MKRIMKNKKGFTMAELLIVVAIIAVLVAIAIPVFTTQLEKSRCATDIANLRSSYAEAVASALTEQDSGVGTEYDVRHTDESAFASQVDAAGLDSTLASKAKADTISGGKIKVTVDKNGVVTSVK